MDFESRAKHNENHSNLEDLGKDQEERIKVLLNIIKECEESLITCKSVLGYIPGSSMLRKRIDAVLKDIREVSFNASSEI